MNIFYTIDGNFCAQCAVGVVSTCENNRDLKDLHFYVGALNVPEEDRAKITALAESFGRQITFLEIGDLKERIGFDFDTYGWNEIIIARLFLGELLPPEVKRVLYMDSDTVTCGSLKHLEELDLKGHVLGAVIEATMNRRRRKAIGLEKEPYVNSGVLLVDVEKWRRERMGEKVLEFYRGRGGALFCPDQDAINGAVKGRVLILSPKYNFFTQCWYYPYRVLKRLCAPAPFVPEKVFNDACAHPAVIHYLGEVRPWRRGNGHRYEHFYHDFLARTPYAGQPQEENWTGYFRVYNAFLAVLRPFPYLRYWITDTGLPLLFKFKSVMRKRRG